MISHFRNILNLNEKVAYNILGKIRQYILPFFNSNLRFQEHKVKRWVIENLDQFTSNFYKSLPSVTKSKYIELVSDKQKNEILAIADKVVLR